MLTDSYVCGNNYTGLCSTSCIRSWSEIQDTSTDPYIWQHLAALPTMYILRVLPDIGEDVHYRGVRYRGGAHNFVSLYDNSLSGS